MELVATNIAPTLGPKTQSLLHGEVVIRPDLDSSHLRRKEKDVIRDNGCALCLTLHGSYMGDGIIILDS